MAEYKAKLAKRCFYTQIFSSSYTCVILYNPDAVGALSGSAKYKGHAASASAGENEMTRGGAPVVSNAAGD